MANSSLYLQNTVFQTLSLLMTPRGYDAVLAQIDKFTEQNGFIPGKTTWSRMGEECAHFLVAGRLGISRRYNHRQEYILSQGLWKGIFLLLHVKLFFTTAYHPQRAQQKLEAVQASDGNEQAEEEVENENDNPPATSN
ncbi:hypothetical protein N7491_009365 [Penicillium cf. griseofulvum]|uniref:Uncharacterized protein n=1 Tax=Penicillium cf. griseofulvum TaxID=2972120 RepID=A0A9W9MF82_9EURO|nr:hypothetical protein N7472_005042 [Penicillium cf. griseofulvum]KAJ5424149.1 hypothetical protein N7491_009365 [Penicillium cf. griseofulvum]